jgi:phosphate transport system protein
MTTHHLEETLERDLAILRTRIKEMATMGERALETCLLALKNQDRKLAYAVILRDQRIDEREKEVDTLCLEFLIRHQPVGTQLRLVFTAIKINAGLERIGDYAESIARQIVKTAGLSPVPILERFEELAGLSIPMLHDAIAAFLGQDAELARRTMESERRADHLRNQIDAELIRRYQAQEIPLEVLTRFITVARRLERVSDQAKNFCEETLYVATGEYAKHRGAGSWRILFVDETGGCLGPMAVVVGQSLRNPRFEFECAGVGRGSADAFTRSFLAGKKLEVEIPEPQSLDQVAEPEHFQVIVELGALSRSPAPVAGSKAILLQWAVPDPVLVTGTPEEVHGAYERAFQAVLENIRDLVEAVLGDNPS